jgi:hypothetical protein
VGVKVTLMAQLAPTASVDGHAFVCAKSPLIWTELMLNGVPPTFFSVTI